MSASKALVVANPPLSLPTPVLTFLKWLELTSGRDKVYRFVAYFSKWVVQTMRENKVNPDLADRLAKGSSAIGQTRKLMRFFRSIEYVQEFLKSTAIKDDAEKYLSLFKSFSLAVWMVADHAQWLHKAGYLKLNDHIKKIDEVHSKAWFWGLLAGLVLCVYKLKLLMDETSSVNEQMRIAAPENKEALVKNNKALQSIDEKKNKQIQGIVKNGIDLIIPAARLNWIPVSDGTVGLAGTATSIIGMIDTWPKNK